MLTQMRLAAGRQSSVVPCLAKRHLSSRTKLFHCSNTSARGFRAATPLLALIVAFPLANVASNASCYWWPFGSSQGSPANTSSRKHEITLYQYQPCPFCNKVRAVLDYHKLPYTVVEVNPMRKKELDFSKDYKKVPICVIDGEVYKDSTDIVDKLHDVVVADGGKVANRSPEEHKWREWLDTRLIKLFSPNIYRTPSEALQAFDYIVDESNFSYWEQIAARYFGAAVMYLIGRRNVRKLEVSDERQALVDTVNQWVEEGVGSKQFHGGKKPSLTDLEIFGVLRALEGMRTTRDDLFSRSKVAEWYERMKAVVGPDMRLNKREISQQHNYSGSKESEAVALK